MKKRVATQKEIAKRLNISVSSVSRALQNHHTIGLGTRLKVQKLAKELNYEPNQTAIFFQQQRRFTIGVILPELSEYFFSAAITGIEDAAYKHKYTVLIGQSHDNEAKEKQLVTTMKEHRVDGLIVSVSKNTVNLDHFKMLKEYGLPIVFFDRIPALPDIHYVACNVESGTVKAINFLIKKGHKVIGLINGPTSLTASRERLNGYIEGLTKRKIKYDPSLVADTDLSKQSTEEAIGQLLGLKRKPTAIVAFNDYVALDAVQYALKKGFTIYRDLSFVSYANLPMSSYTAFPPLASVEQFPYQQGENATEILLKLLGNEPAGESAYKIILEPELVIHDLQPGRSYV